MTAHAHLRPYLTTHSSYIREESKILSTLMIFMPSMPTMLASAIFNAN